MNIDFTYAGDQLTVNGCRLSFPYEIRAVRTVNHLVIVLLSIPDDDDIVDNLYAVNSEGEIVWQSQHLREVYPSGLLLAYEEIDIKDRRILATDFYGRCYFIDPDSGKILGREIYK